MALTLYTYYRSSAAYRVRIALGLKGLAAEPRFIHLVRNGGEQKSEAFRRINPNATVPALVTEEGTAIVQSLAIIEYLEEIRPEPPLLPGNALARAQIRAAAQVIACDIHPVNNSRVGAYLKSEFGHSQEDVITWMHHWMRNGLLAYQALLPEGTRFSFGDNPTLADCCLVPQLYNLRRWNAPADGLDRLLAIEAACLALPAFEAARPENQPDFE
ncbi:maleylacetoacetate isomerase [Rhabdaerophilum sp. SD176]|uniref:maleylacetoacetate isomerase n=1 Tax=Rhabdaerophilum sp. SD176 TaxID=2983548 RepID=UPI0024DF6FDE|nr:maleylacetoacetate isomerase [Rhabdaerophilum sp. SD176]